MKLKFLHFFCFSAIVVLFSCSNASSQTLDWSGSFTPVWTPGATSRTATAVAPGVNVSVAITNSEPGTFTDVTWLTPSPAVNVNNALPDFLILSGTTDCLEMDVDWTSNTGFINVVYTFTKPVYNLDFRVGDIDKIDPPDEAYYDRITVTGLNGGATILPTITAVQPTPGFLTIAGNVASANPSSAGGGNAITNNGTNQEGTVQISFGAQGITQLTVRYDNLPIAPADPEGQIIAIGNLTFSLVNIAGTVYHDANNSANNTFSNIFTAGETGTNAGSTLYANLVNSSGIVLSSVAVAADGTYALTGPTNATNLTVRISSTQGTPGSAAPANTMPPDWTNTSPLQTAAFNTTTANISGTNFGVERLPESAISVQTGVGNPGGFGTVTVPAAAFQTATGGNPNTGDAGGTVTNMRIIAFPTNTNAITINSVTYTNGGACAPSISCTAWPGGGVTIGYTNSVGPAVPITIDPLDGNVNAVISFVAIDNAGKEDASAGSVTLPFTIIPLTGLVFNDANGDLTQNGADQVINGTNAGGGLSAGAVLYANLVNAAGIVIATAPVQTNGVYSFANVPQNSSNLIIQVNSQQGTIGLVKPTLIAPTGWGITGENKNGQGGAADVVRNGEIVLSTGTVSISQQHFGLERLPVATTKFYSIDNPAVNSFITLNGTGPNPGPLSGTDEEDGVLGNSSKVAITSLPGNSNELWYNGVRITVGQDGLTAPSTANPFVIPNYNPALLQLKATGPGSLDISFTYAFMDAANLQGASVFYTVNWSYPLPITLIHFTARTYKNNCVLQWEVANAEAYWYEVEYSCTATGSYARIGTVYANSQSGTYTFTHLNATQSGTHAYYRLKLIDGNGNYSYSFLVNVPFNKQFSVHAFPGLLKAGEKIQVHLSGSSRSVYKVILFDYSGRMLQEKNTAGTSNLNFETSRYKAGAYFIVVTGEGVNQTIKIVLE